MSAALAIKAVASGQLRQSVLTVAVMACKTVGFVTGALPPEPPALPRRWGMQMGHLLARAGRALPQNLRGGKGSL